MSSTSLQPVVSLRMDWRTSIFSLAVWKPHNVVVFMAAEMTEVTLKSHVVRPSIVSIRNWIVAVHALGIVPPSLNH